MDALDELVKRRLPATYVSSIHFKLDKVTIKGFDVYIVECNVDFDEPSGKEVDDDSSYVIVSYSINITSPTSSGCAAGLLRYLRDICEVDMYWSDMTLGRVPSTPPLFDQVLTGASSLQYRYYMNVCTFSYSYVWWDWTRWEQELDWMALHGINTALAFTGQEYLWTKAYIQLGLDESDLDDFFAGPAFLAWGRMGNIQGTWTGRPLPTSWKKMQWELQKRIVRRMRELGIKPILPSFAGFVPRAINKAFPNLRPLKSSIWNYFPAENSAVLHIHPSEVEFQIIAKTFLEIQSAELGDDADGNFYSVDLYNELIPASLDDEYLRSSTRGVVQSIKQAGTKTVWIMQGWMFAYEKDKVWRRDRIDALLSGASADDMIILDLFSESQPYYETYGDKRWIWCLLHDFGGNMGLFGEVDVMKGALQASRKPIGVGITMEGTLQNELVYHFMLDVPLQTSRNIRQWIQKFVKQRYGHTNDPLLDAWDILRKNVYSNPYHNKVHAVNKSICELRPDFTGLAGQIGDHPTMLHYNPKDLVRAWSLLRKAYKLSPNLLESTSFQYDLADMTRQVLANLFLQKYERYIKTKDQNIAGDMLDILSDLDKVLMTDDHFLLSNWISDAKRCAGKDNQLASFYEKEARNQITLWGPDGQNFDYASKQWGGLVRSFYIPRWRIFFDAVAAGWNRQAYLSNVYKFEVSWQDEKWGTQADEGWTTRGRLEDVLSIVARRWFDT